MLIKIHFSEGGPRYFFCAAYLIDWRFSDFLIALTVNGQESRVNHENIHSTERTSHLGEKTSKFDTWNSDVWRHVKTCFARVRSRVDAIDGNQPPRYSTFQMLTLFSNKLQKKNIIFRPPYWSTTKVRTPIWRLHTGLYKFLRNISTNI